MALKDGHTSPLWSLRGPGCVGGGGGAEGGASQGPRHRAGTPDKAFQNYVRNRKVDEKGERKRNNLLSNTNFEILGEACISDSPCNSKGIFRKESGACFIHFNSM